MKSNTDNHPERNDAAPIPQGRRHILNPIAVRNARPRAAPYKLLDGAGLFLWVTPTGRKVWRTNYVTGGVKHMLTLGEYPAMSLAQARDARALTRAQVRGGANPTRERDLAREARSETAARTFEPQARRWLAVQGATKWAPSYAAEVLARFEREAFGHIGAMPIADIRPEHVIRLLERRLMDQAGRKGSRAVTRLLRQNLHTAFRYWQRHGWITTNPVDDLAAMFDAGKEEPRPAVLKLGEARAVLAAIEGGAGTSVALKLLHRFQLLTCVRPSEARLARWNEFTDEGAFRLWRIPAERMKGKSGLKEGHDVPLSRQAEEVLTVARTIWGASSPYVFPGAGRVNHQHNPLSDSSLADAMHRALDRVPALRGRQVPHGWRATFASIMAERNPADEAVIDRMLAHKQIGDVRWRYNRTRHSERSIALGREWADLILDGAPSAWWLAGLADPALTGEVIAFPAREAA